MKFVKMHGCGNSYIYMDVRGKNLSDEYLGALSEKVADKNKGIGSDGLIVLDDSQVADGRMRMFNADGSEGAMCGNGIRCLAKLMYERAGIRKDELAIETKSGIKTVKVVLENGIVTGATVDMGSPDFTAAHIPVLTDTGLLATGRKADGVSSADEKDAEKSAGAENVSEAAGVKAAAGNSAKTVIGKVVEAVGAKTVAGKAAETAGVKTAGKRFIDLEEETSIVLPDEDEEDISLKEEPEITDLSIELDDEEEELTDAEKEERREARREVGEKKEFVNQTILIKNGDGDIEDFTITCVSMGNPHAVTFVDTVRRDDFAVIGPEFENNAIFPDRINTEFVKKIDRGHVKMRVWERGSGETMACGTGACATVAAGVKTGRLDPRVEVEMTGGTLSLYYDTEANHIYMTGEAVEICEGDLFF